MTQIICGQSFLRFSTQVLLGYSGFHIAYLVYICFKMFKYRLNPQNKPNISPLDPYSAASLKASLRRGAHFSSSLSVTSPGLHRGAPYLSAGCHFSWASVLWASLGVVACIAGVTPWGWPQPPAHLVGRRRGCRPLAPSLVCVNHGCETWARVVKLSVLVLHSPRCASVCLACTVTELWWAVVFSLKDKTFFFQVADIQKLKYILCG